MATGASSGSAKRRQDWLAEAKTRAQTKEPVGLTVRQLLGYWGQKRRGSRVARQVEADLTSRGLRTLPNFMSVTIDEVVYLIEAEAEPVTPEAAVEWAEVRDLGLKVGHLESAHRQVLHVTPDASYEEVMTVMLLNDYSQLGVWSSPHHVKGAVTWKSIAQARLVDPKEEMIKRAIVPAHLVPYDDELIDVLPKLDQADFVFVTGPDRAVRGIVTSADVVRRYEELATPFLLIGEVDQTLRRIVERAFPLREVTAACGDAGADTIGSYDDLSIGDYQRILESPERWSRLGWPLDRVAFVARLDEIRTLRNDIMHFDPDPLPDNAVANLRNFLKVLRDWLP